MPCLMTQEQVGILKRLATEAASPGMLALEIGSFTGDSANAIMEVVGVVGGRLYCIDSFTGNETAVGPNEPRYYADNSVLLEFLRNTKPWRDTDSLILAIGKSEYIAPVIAGGAFDFIFVDGDHRYTPFRKDLRLWSPRLRPGGIICGHDLDMPLDSPEVDLARAEECKERDFVDNCHYGIWLALREVFGTVNHEDKIWWIRRSW